MCACVLSGSTQLSQYQKGKTNRDLTQARDSEWQWHQLGHMQVCTALQTDNHASTPPLSFLHAGCPSCHPTNSVKALKAVVGKIYTSSALTNLSIWLVYARLSRVVVVRGRLASPIGATASQSPKRLTQRLLERLAPRHRALPDTTHFWHRTHTTLM